jgi:septum site-determining protein MinC
MTKIAIISQPEQGVLIDIGGCDTLHEATQHLSSTFQVSNQFWENQPVDLNLGKLRLSRDEFAQILAILSERGVNARQFFCEEEATVQSLRAHSLEPATGKPGENPPPPPITNVTLTEAAADAAGLGTWGEAGTEAKADETAEGKAAEGSEPKAEGDAATTTDTTPVKAPAPPAAPPVPHILYLRQTLRSGQSVSHKGHLVIVGDVNPGAEVMAEGDITIWGALRGMAHAGIAGNTSSEIRALKFDPIQLRIAHAIARSPDRPKANLRTTGPETARIVNGTIRISSSAPE